MPDDVRRAAVERFAAACQADAAVVAAFLGGSLAAGTADEVADLDLYVVTAEDDLAAFHGRREEFLRCWCEPLLTIDVLNFEGLGFDMLLFACSDGTWGELAFGHTGNFVDTHGGPFEPLVDKAGLLEGIEFPLYVPSQDEHGAAAESALRWFWHDALNLRKVLARGRAVSAAAYLAKLRAHVLTLLDAAEALEAEVDSAGVLERLAETTRCPDADSMRAAARELVELHGIVGAPVSAALGRDYPAELARDLTARLR